MILQHLACIGLIYGGAEGLATLLACAPEQSAASRITERLSPCSAVICLPWGRALKCAAEAEAEAEIMRALRQAVHDADPLWTAHLSGWNPANPTPHCSWQYVKCDALARVTAM